MHLAAIFCCIIYFNLIVRIIRIICSRYIYPDHHSYSYPIEYISSSFDFYFLFQHRIHYYQFTHTTHIAIECIIYQYDDRIQLSYSY